MYDDPTKLYRQSSLGNTTPIGLVITLYDRLAADLGAATSAMRAGDIEARCHALGHASLVVGQLQDWVNMHTDDPLAESLVSFYQVLRAGMLEASARCSAQVLEQQIDLVLQVRDAWQEREDLAAASALEMPTPGLRGSVGEYAA